LVRGSIATLMTGSGKTIVSSLIGWSGAHSDRRSDVAGVDLGDVLAVVGVHHQDPPDALDLARARVHHAGARGEIAGVDAEVGQLADERVGHDLEGERRERRALDRRALGLAAVLVAAHRLDAGDRRDVERRRQVVDHGVEQRLDALVLERRAAQHGGHRDLERRLADRALEHGLGDLLVLDQQLDEGVVVARHLLEQMLAGGGRLLDQVVGDLALVDVDAEIVLVVDRLHPHEVDDPQEVGL